MIWRYLLTCRIHWLRRIAFRKLNVYLPAAMVGYFDELSEAGKRGEADPDVLGEIATKYAVEVIGPVPEGYL